MRFHVGSDHGGVDLRKALAETLREWGHEVLSELGPNHGSERVDYPHLALDVCQRVLRDRREGGADVFGLLVCGTGQGVAMAANKIPGIRAGVVADGFSAQMVRAHNDANVLCLGQRVLGTELAKHLLRCFVEAEFEGGRHATRVDLLERLPVERGCSARPTGEGS